MILAFGVIILAFIGAIGASLAAPLAVVVGGVTRARGGRRWLAAGLLTWVGLTAAVIAGMVLGMAGDAGRGVDVFGVPLDDLLALAPVAWLLAALIGVGFAVAARRRGGGDGPASPAS